VLGLAAVGGCTLETEAPGGDPAEPEVASDAPSEDDPGEDDAEEDGGGEDGGGEDGGGEDDADGPADAPADEDESAAAGDTAIVEVYFANPDVEPEPAVFPVEREVEVPAVLAGALGELLEGPSEEEEEEGFTSFFSTETADLLESVRLDDDGVAYVDFDASLPEVIPEASTSAGSATLTEALDATATQFDTVDEAVYRLEGDVDAFYLWLQLTPPD
jgi:hypothetical protein